MAKIEECVNDSAPGSTSLPAATWQCRPFLLILNRFLLKMFRCFLIAVLIVGVASYVALSPPALTTLFPGIVLCPAKTDLSEFKIDSLQGIKPEDVYFKNNDSDTLHGWFFQSVNPNARVMLVSHGNGGNIAYTVRGLSRLLACGVSIFAYDYRGYGKSTGKQTMSGALADGEAAYVYLINTRKIDPARIIIYGGSFGGSVACHLAASKPAAALIIESTFSSLLKEGRERVFFLNYYPDFLQPIPALDNGAVLKGKHPPLLIIHGVKDELIHFWQAEDNFAQASQPKTFIALPDSGHAVNDADLQAYNTGLKAFLADLK